MSCLHTYLTFCEMGQFLKATQHKKDHLYNQLIIKTIKFIIIDPLKCNLQTISKEKFCEHLEKN